MSNIRVPQNPGIDFDLTHLTPAEELAIQQLGALGNPASDKIIYRDSAGDFHYVTIGSGLTFTTGTLSAGASGHTIQDEGVSLTTRGKLNFVGSNVVVTDDAGNDATVVTISAGTGDFVGPGSSIANNLVGFNGTTGKLGKDSGIASSNVALLTGASFIGQITQTQTSNGIVSVQVQNLSNGIAAASEFTAVADNGTSKLMLGVAGSGYNQGTGLGATEAYIFSTTGELNIGTESANAVRFFIGSRANANSMFSIGTNAGTTAAVTASGYLSAYNTFSRNTTTATSGGTLTLTIASLGVQILTGTSNHTIVLPVASGLVSGFSFTIVNTSTGTLTVNTSGGNNLVNIPSNRVVYIICSNTAGGTGTASWTYFAMGTPGIIPDVLDTTTVNMSYNAATGQTSADVIDNTSTQKIVISKAGSTIGTRKQLNLIEGTNVTMTVADNPGSDRVDVTINSSGGGGGAGNQTVTAVNQTAHGFSVGNVIRSSGAGTYTKAQADSAANAEVVGYVTVVTDVDNFKFVTAGEVLTGVPVVAAGTVMFLDAATAGALTAVEPGSVGYISKPLLIVTQSGTSGIFVNMRGMENTSTPTSGAKKNNTTVDLGAAPVWAKEFTITDTDVVPTSIIIPTMAYDATSDNDADELEMSLISCSVGQTDTGSFKLLVTSSDGPISGHLKINYITL